MRVDSGLNSNADIVTRYPSHARLLGWSYTSFDSFHCVREQETVFTTFQTSTHFSARRCTRYHRILESASRSSLGQRVLFSLAASRSSIMRIMEICKSGVPTIWPYMYAPCRFCVFHNSQSTLSHNHRYFYPNPPQSANLTA